MADDPTRWIVHGSRRVYASSWVNVDLDDVEVPGGRRFDHHVLRFPRASVGAVVLDSDRVLLLWRHRFTTDTWGWEIPAGWADPGENTAEATRREIMEETGYRVSTMRPLMTYHPMSGISSQRYQLFVGSDVERIGEPQPTETSRIMDTPPIGTPADGHGTDHRRPITDRPSLLPDNHPITAHHRRRPPVSAARRSHHHRYLHRFHGRPCQIRLWHQRCVQRRRPGKMTTSMRLQEIVPEPSAIGRNTR